MKSDKLWFDKCPVRIRDQFLAAIKRLEIKSIEIKKGEPGAAEGSIYENLLTYTVRGFRKPAKAKAPAKRRTR